MYEEEMIPEVPVSKRLTRMLQTFSILEQVFFIETAGEKLTAIKMKYANKRVNEAVDALCACHNAQMTFLWKDEVKEWEEELDEMASSHEEWLAAVTEEEKEEFWQDEIQWPEDQYGDC